MCWKHLWSNLDMIAALSAHYLVLSLILMLVNTQDVMQLIFLTVFIHLFILFFFTNHQMNPTWNWGHLHLLSCARQMNKTRSISYPIATTNNTNMSHTAMTSQQWDWPFAMIVRGPQEWCFLIRYQIYKKHTIVQIVDTVTGVKSLPTAL